VVTASSPTPDAAARRPAAVLDAVLERITYANEETGYTIARVATDRSGTDLLTVVGSLLGVQPGESLRLVGRWGSHPRYGRQFEVDSFTTVLPATVQGIERYLGSGLIRGIGPRMAARIVAHFGADTLRVIEEESRDPAALPRRRRPDGRPRRPPAGVDVRPARRRHRLCQGLGHLRPGPSARR
jgi:exodeoxyribonuclease V alpha subunit